MDIAQLYELYRKHPIITTDSRDCPEGSIFLALRGASFNGNRFALQALQKGCSYAIVDEDIDITGADEAVLRSRLIRVDDALQTFKALAREHRRQFQMPIVGITGTNGKTTTKELIRAVLSECYQVMATEGNFNNDVGVPKTLLRLHEGHDIGVVEMGASHPGDIRTLVETAEPTCGLITNVGRAHLQGFGSFEGVCRTKGELYDYLSSNDLPIFVNRDNQDLMRVLETSISQHPTPTDHRPDIYYYGQSGSPDILIHGEVVAPQAGDGPFLRFRWREQDVEAGYVSDWMEVQTHLIGAYNLDNLLAAIIVGYVNGVPFEQINHALTSYQPTNSRSQFVQTEHNQLVVDAYNANPSSMAAAIDNFSRMAAPQKLAILGDMRELGDVSREEHQRVVDQLRHSDIGEVWLVGEEFMQTDAEWPKYKDVEELKRDLARQLPHDRVILIKGSNGTRLFELPPLL